MPPATGTDFSLAPVWLTSPMNSTSEESPENPAGTAAAVGISATGAGAAAV